MVVVSARPGRRLRVQVLVVAKVRRLLVLSVVVVARRLFVLAIAAIVFYFLLLKQVSLVARLPLWHLVYGLLPRMVSVAAVLFT